MTASRLRRYFVMRGALAEAIGLYGLLAGMLRAPAAYTVGLFAVAAIIAHHRARWHATNTVEREVLVAWA